MTKIQEIENFAYPSILKGYKPKKVSPRNLGWYLYWFAILFLIAFGVFLIGLVAYVNGIQVASAHETTYEVCNNLNDYSNGASFREYCMKNVL